MGCSLFDVSCRYYKVTRLQFHTHSNIHFYRHFCRGPWYEVVVRVVHSSHFQSFQLIYHAHIIYEHTNVPGSSELTWTPFHHPPFAPTLACTLTSSHTKKLLCSYPSRTALLVDSTQNYSIGWELIKNNITMKNNFFNKLL